MKMKNFEKLETLAFVSIILIAVNQIYEIVPESKHRIVRTLKSNIQNTTMSANTTTSNNRTTSNPKPQSYSRIFCLMLTQKKTLETKAKFMTKAWANHCDNYKLVLLFNNDTSGITEIDHVLQPPGVLIDTYKELTDKVFNALKYVFSKYPKYDWYIKADDDTFMFIDNLRWFLSQKNSSKPITFGYVYFKLKNSIR